MRKESEVKRETNMMKEENKEEAEKMELDYNGGQRKEGENKGGGNRKRI
jgi:hypothetical protein